jgi:16S rRNA (cytosine967-C5)-methyltransferase
MSARKATSGKHRQKRDVVVSPARLAAFEILRRVEEEGAFASVLLAASDKEMRSDDRALAYELVMGVLRWQLWLDHSIEHYSGRSAAKLDAPVRRALRMGLYQLRRLSRIPASAVVNESVNLAYHARLRSAGGLINAVLRRATREPEFDPAASISDWVERIAVETSHPVWLIERWSRAFGFEETENFARANNESPPVAFRLTAKTVEGASVLERLREAGASLTLSQIAPHAWRIEGAGPLVRELAREGLLYLQDEASQLVAHVLDAQEGERVLDVCAAPGSKTTHIASRTQNEALIVAGDLYEHRLRTVREACARQGVKNVRTVSYDATRALPFGGELFDRVLVDAPCTGTGTLRRNPEIRWRITASDIAELSARQKLILYHASRMVRHGGRLVYSTCSIEREENEATVAAFLAENSDFKPDATRLPQSLLTVDGAARTWPQRDGVDGFFIAAFERRS